MKSANRIGAATSAALLLAAFALAPLAAARADDFGPRGDVSAVRSAAQRLLAHGARGSKGDLADIHISDVVVVHDAALLSWQTGNGHGMMGLIRQYDRWWDAADIYALPIYCWGPATTAYPLPGAEWQSDGFEPAPPRLLALGFSEDVVAAASVHNEDVREHTVPAHPSTPRPGMLPRPSPCTTEFYRFPHTQPIQGRGGELRSSRSDTSGYQIAVRYAANDSNGAVFHVPYARAPTQAEIIPYPTTYYFVSNAVLYFDVMIDGTKPVTFAAGTTIDIWFPFVLDDTLQYDLTIGFADRPIGPIYAKPFDNVLHYTLPGFTVTPGRTLMAEIDGNRP